MKSPTIEDLVAAYAAGKSIRYSTSSGYSELSCRKQGYPHGTPRYGFRHCSHTTEGKSLAFLTRSPEESIRAALMPAKQDGTTRTLEIWDKVAEATSAPVSPPLVPLGENVTRDGRKARVICIDRVSPVFNPVIALVTGLKGREMYVSYSKSGRYRGKRDTPLDLVGHLPPEPVKPREFWLNYYPSGKPVPHPSKERADDMSCGDRTECVHVREVLPGEVDELESLREWKRQAMSSTPDWQAIGKEMGLTLGQDVPSKILPYIRSLKKFIGDLRQPAVSAAVERDAESLLEP